MSERGGELIAKEFLDGENEDDNHGCLKTGVKQEIDDGCRGGDKLVHGSPSVWFG